MEEEEDQGDGICWIKGGREEEAADAGAQGSAELLLSSQAPAGAVKVQLLFVFLALSGADMLFPHQLLWESESPVN